jgi:hypothetical protein
MQLSTKISLTSLLLTVAITSASSAGAATITQWNFNTPGTPDNNTGTGTLTASTGPGTIANIGSTTFTYASGDANGGSSDPATGDDSGWNLTAFPTQGAGNKTAGIQVNVSTVGFNSVIVNFDQRHSNTAARDVQFQYSLNGTTFVDFATFSATAGDTWFNNRTVDLSTVAGAANNANFAFRVVALFSPVPTLTGYAASTSTSTYGTAGTWRFDQVTVNGTAVPEPSAAAGLFSLGLVGGAARLVRSRRKVQA